MQNQPVVQTNSRAVEKNKFEIARANLLAVLAFSAINTILVAIGADVYFLFSAWIPLLLAEVGRTMLAAPQFTFLFPVLIVASIILILPYFFCWFFSKKHVGWMVGALTYFAMDCALLIILCVMSGDFVSSLVDLLFHAWVMYYLISGVRSGFKLQKMPAPEPMPTGGSILLNEEPNGTAADAAESTVAASAIPDSPILRTAGNEEKVKVYVEAQWNGYSIVYRKYGKNTEELVINGNVYAEYVFRGLAKPNTMSATVGGMQISAGYFQRNFIAVNDQIIAASVRWI